MSIVGWVVWGLGCLVLFANIGVSLSSRDPSARWLARRYSFLLAVGLVATGVFGISKLHLIWWVPAAFAINMIATGASVERGTKRWLERHEVSGSARPVGLWVLVSLATSAALLDVLNLRTGRRILDAAEEDAFAKVYQSILLYICVLVDIYIGDLIGERRMRLLGIPWDEFQAEREILTGIADALAPGSEDGEVPEDDEMRVTSDAYQSYLTNFLQLSIAEYETAISEMSREEGRRPVDQHSIAANQFLDRLFSEEWFGEDARDAKFLATINRFAKEARRCVQRSCNRHVRGRTIESSWD